MTRRLPALLPLLLLLAAPASVSAADRFVHPNGVDNDNCGKQSVCRTIARAVAVAAEGDTIHLAAGDYPEAVLVSGKALSFRGAGAATRVVAPAGQPALKLTDGGRPAPT